MNDKASTRPVRAPMGFFLTEYFFVCLFRVSCDVFAWWVSPAFGTYGINVQGEPFSWRFWVSIAVFLIVALSHAAYASRRLDALDVGIILLFLASYVPISSAWWITEDSDQFFAFASIFWIFVYTILSVMRWKRPQRQASEGKVVGGLAVIFAAVLVFLSALLVARFGFPTELGFDTVYQRRSDYAKWLPGGAITYLFSWSVFVFCTYIFLIPRYYLLKILAFLYLYMAYSVSGHKIYVLLIPVLVLVNLIVSRRLTWILSPLFAVGTIISVLFYWGSEIWVPSLTQRLLVLPADISFRYMDFFKQHLLYSYSFLSKFFPYEYTELPGNLIGTAYYTLGDNATAGFLVDAFINIGWFGLLPLIIFFVLLRNLLPPARDTIIVIPFLAQLLDTPLPTSLLTGGGGLMIAVVFLMSRLGRSKEGGPESFELDPRPSTRN